MKNLIYQIPNLQNIILIRPDVWYQTLELQQNLISENVSFLTLNLFWSLIFMSKLFL